MPRTLFASLTFLALAAAPAAADVAAGLRGSPASMQRQHMVALANDYTFLRTPSQVRQFVDRGYLVEIPGGDGYRVLKSVSYPYARPELRVFLERLGKQHLEACGEELVVTSLTRPKSEQPRNSHALSVHPTGMAVDLRVLDNARCRSWLEDTLLSLERQGVLDVTRERRPPHYHVAVFPTEYMAYAAPLIARDSAIAERERLAAEKAARNEAIRKLAASSSMMLSPGESTEEEAERGNGVAVIAAVITLAIAGLARKRILNVQF